MGPVTTESGTLVAPASGLLGLDEATTIFFLALISATLGAIVAWTAYRGYVRNESRPMLFLATGVVFLTTVPFALSYGFDWLLDATDSQVLLVITVCHLLGVGAIVHALRGTRE